MILSCANTAERAAEGPSPTDHLLANVSCGGCGSILCVSGIHLAVRPERMALYIWSHGRVRSARSSR